MSSLRVARPLAHVAPAGRGGRVTRWAIAVAAAAAGVLVASCGAASSAEPHVEAPSSSSATVWLCRAGTAPDPCAKGVDVTSVPATGARTVTDTVAAASSPYACFFVYPTVSPQQRTNSTLKVQDAERAVAVSQASPFSQLCAVYAPMYRQRTLVSIARGLGADRQANAVAYDSLLSGWRSFLAHEDDGRPFILIGHSQGAAMLIRLVRGQIDDDAALRARLVSAIILGGNVTVPVGGVVGGSFRHVPLCTAPAETGCVIAYSSFPAEPPADSVFGRPGQGVSLQSGQLATVGMQVACVNPAAIAGGTGVLDPLFIATAEPAPGTPVATRWVTYPQQYSSSCETAGGATWLQVSDVAPAGDDRPVVQELLGASWGYHVDDVNLALGNLLDDVRAQEAAYAAPAG